MATILVVDDEPAAARGLAGLLRTAGHTVLERTERFNADDMPAADLAVVDLALGDGVDGYEVARRLAARAMIVVVSGVTEPPAGSPYPFIRKPVDGPALRTMVAGALAHRMLLPDPLASMPHSLRLTPPPVAAQAHGRPVTHNLVAIAVSIVAATVAVLMFGGSAIDRAVAKHERIPRHSGAASTEGVAKLEVKLDAMQGDLVQIKVDLARIGVAVGASTRRTEGSP